MKAGFTLDVFKSRALWKKWTLWIVANAVGFGLGLPILAFSVIMILMFNDAPPRNLLDWHQGAMLFGGISGIIGGFFIGFMQGIMLMSVSPHESIRPLLWIILTTIVFGIVGVCLSIYMVPGSGAEKVPIFLMLPVAGVIVGGAQQLIIPKSYGGTNRWIWLNILSMGISLGIVDVVLSGLSNPGYSISPLVAVISAGVGGIVYGTITGLGLFQIFKESS